MGQINKRKYMIVIKDNPDTLRVRHCKYNSSTQRWDVTFLEGQIYSYLYHNVEMLNNPIEINPELIRISRNGYVFSNISAIYEFRGKSNYYWCVYFDNGEAREYNKRDLTIKKSCLIDKQSSNTFEYIKEISKLITFDDSNKYENLLADRLNKITYIDSETALSKYLNPSSMQSKHIESGYTPIFPFGCNNSQYSAVKQAFESQISAIQGPPGTGKTQTILNIIANILLQDKTVLVVSNNNSATQNVYDKLSSSKYDLGFIAAFLGNFTNKHNFIENQNSYYPDFSHWEINENATDLYSKISEKSEKAKNVFNLQEEQARKKQELSKLNTEQEYFLKWIYERNIHIEIPRHLRSLTSQGCKELHQKCLCALKKKNKLGFLQKVELLLKCGIAVRKLFKYDLEYTTLLFQFLFYQSMQAELNKRLAEIESELNGTDSSLINCLCEMSMTVLKDKLAKKYKSNFKRRHFSEDDLWKNPFDVLAEYPVILSTTFSARNSLNSNVIYDYVIIDEASQVDIVTGALALSCAKNAVIVGDTNQLPNIVQENLKNKAKSVFNSFNIQQGYMYTNSFLQSVIDVIPNMTQTMLREHYRCHPQIINFCNQKFYNNELIIMTKDNGESDVLSVVKTVKGNHERDHYSQRQIDVIKREILPKLSLNPDETGIVTPYKNQVSALNNDIEEFESATVHKYQGKEKDNIIISTVDDEISDFADDPYLINVAVSRAKKKLILVITGNEQPKGHNITDLVDYIRYRNFEVADSKIHSIFDYLYKQYTEERKEFLKKHKKVSEYDSENLMFALLEDILSDEKYKGLDVLMCYPMNILIKPSNLLSEEEIRYAMNPLTHIDFLIYNNISKKTILAVEVDGYAYHKQNTVQSARDQMKDYILEQYNIPLLRLKTNGSEEKEKIKDMLERNYI